MYYENTDLIIIVIICQNTWFYHQKALAFALHLHAVRNLHFRRGGGSFWIQGIVTLALHKDVITLFRSQLPYSLSIFSSVLSRADRLRKNVINLISSPPFNHFPYVIESTCRVLLQECIKLILLPSPISSFYIIFSYIYVSTLLNNY